MAIGFPAQYTEIVPFAADPQTAIETAKSALEELGLRCTQPDPQTLRAKIGINPLSWGEVLLISIEAPNQLRVQSRCKIQLFDWGKNKRNVHQFLQIFNRKLRLNPSTPPAPSIQPYDQDGQTPLQRALGESK
jgi:hypothetical protein